MKIKSGFLYFSLVLAMFFWGLTFVVFKIAYETYQPLTIIFIRLLISVIFLFFFARILNQLQVIKRKDFHYIAILALFEPFFYFLGESYGLTYVSSTMGAVIISTIPLIVSIAAFFMYNERLTVLNWIGIIISFLGVLIVIFSSNTEFDARLKGVILMFLAVFSAVGYGLTVKKLAHNYNGFTITAYQNLIGTILFFPLFLIFDWNKFLHTVPPMPSILSIIYLAIFGSSVTFIIFTRAVREIGVSKANIFTNLIPVFAALFSYLILKEPMPLLKILGIVIVLAGLIMSQFRGKVEVILHDLK